MVTLTGASLDSSTGSELEVVLGVSMPTKRIGGVRFSEDKTGQAACRKVSTSFFLVHA
jgi:hypothetical protein